MTHPPGQDFCGLIAQHDASPSLLHNPNIGHTPMLQMVTRNHARWLTDGQTPRTSSKEAFA